MSGPSKWDWTLTRIAWIDVETDGLVRPGCRFPLCLEVALIVTDEHLRELGRYEAVISHPGEVLDALDPHPVVVEMHNKSGLWEALRDDRTASLEDAQAAMIELLNRTCGEPGESDACPVVWGGFSPAAIDRPVLARYMPRYYRRIHHRSVDVSALKLAMQNWAGIEVPKVEAAHRAMTDTLESISVARVYRRFLAEAAHLRRDTLPSVEGGKVQAPTTAVGSTC
jgi:oligoribonuclease (3'-5' exoribonuclease)